MHVVDHEQHLAFECPAFSHERAIRQQGVFWFIFDCLREVKELAGFDRSLDVDVGMPCQLDTYDSD